MPSRRHSSAMVSSPRNPSRTMRIFSSAEYCLRVARRISLIALAAPVCRVCDFCLIFGHYEEPEILPYAIRLICSIGADVRHPRNQPFRTARIVIRSRRFVIGDVGFDHKKPPLSVSMFSFRRLRRPKRKVVATADFSPIRFFARLN